MRNCAKILVGFLLAAATAAWAVPVLAAPGPETGTQHPPAALTVAGVARPIPPVGPHQPGYG